MKRIVMGMAAAMSLFATGALAADIAARPYVKAPIVDPVWSWTGWYVGANGGYSWGRSRTDVSYFNTPTGTPIAPPAGSITSAAFDMNGGIAGGQAGYNWQRDNWVFGVEGDLQWSGEKGGAGYSCVGAPIAPGAGPCLPTFTFLPPGGLAGTTLSVDQKLQWFGTVRGRVGILATPKVLFYGTRRSGLR
ncbi:outer membrane protein [Bradyrhizobium sp. CCBAU 21360]|uniref:outer membrane protein n=1 Tax=Bradyrhizobium sp. CCBAU 21360 TaxID=1325081 RepID=UPI00230566CA|nr:autotransporter domain-containing protein [Bradyrhizobium sp. CCBAU 21360]